MSAWERRLLDLLCGLPKRRRLVVLSFHRVLERADPLLPHEPSAEAFASQLDLVREHLHVLPLPEAIERLHRGDLPTRAACITFDDGYRNNFEIAAPLLEQRSMSATFFIATGAIEARAMWNDLVISAVRATRTELDLRDIGLDVYRCSSYDERAGAIDSILDAMKYRALHQRMEEAEAIYSRTVGAGVPSLMMSPEMIRELATRGHDVGAHTVSHPILANLADHDARREIVDSRDWVANVTGVAPVSFAYPNGRPGRDFRAEHRALVQQAGFRCAVSTEWGCATRRSDAYAVPRMTPWETTRRGFASRLAKTYVRSYQANSP
jgi:peptidoglycan/xylan/chitin deacetylase (PgdA/CDA1 family)